MLAMCCVWKIEIDGNINDEEKDEDDGNNI
jgi:hypothetical protein